MNTQNQKIRKMGFVFRKGRWTEKLVPQLRLEGVWMEKIGMEIGGNVLVTVSKGKIIIQKA